MGLTKTAVAVVDHHVASQCPRSVIIDTARSVRDVSHDDTLRSTEPLDDVDNRTAVHEESLWHLEGDSGRSILLDLCDRLGDLEVVVGWEEVGNSGEKEGVGRRGGRQ